MSFPTIYHALPIGGASSLSGLSDRGEPSGKTRTDLPVFEAHSGSMQREDGQIWTVSPAGAAGQSQARQAAGSLRPLAVAGLVLALLASPLAWAGGDHDHGHEHEAAALPGGPAGLPRFTAVSELFELVGVLDGRRLTLYLDRFADGSPVTNGRIELELGAARYTLTADEGGDFSVTLPRAPAPGTLPVTATVLAGEQSDLLAGVLTVAPAAEAAPAPQRMTAGRLAGWGGLAGVLLLGAGLTWRRGRVGAANQREAA